MDMNSTQPEVDEIAKAVGFAISKWGEIEGNLCSLYAAALRIPVYASAREAFYSIISFQAKIKVVDACFKMEFAAEPDLISDWSTFKKDAVKVSKKRNELAHGSVMVVNTDPPTAGWFPFWNGSALDGTTWIDNHVVVFDQSKFRYYTSSQIDGAREEFTTVARKGESLFQKTAANLHAAGKKWNEGNAP